MGENWRSLLNWGKPRQWNNNRSLAVGRRWMVLNWVALIENINLAEVLCLSISGDFHTTLKKRQLHRLLASIRVLCRF